MKRLLVAALVAALTDLAGIGLLASAAWLITRAAEQPPLIALSVAIVVVRALAIGKGTLRYVERLVGHDAALRVLANLRTRVYAKLSAGGSRLPEGDLLARLVSDVDGVQDALLRCAIPAGVAVLVSVATVGLTAVYLPAAAAVLAAGLLLAGLVLPAAAYRIASGAARRTADVRGGYLAASVDVLHGAADPVTPPAEVERVVAKLRTQKGIVIDYELVEGANHFWFDHLPEVETRVGNYLDMRLEQNPA